LVNIGFLIFEISNTYGRYVIITSQGDKNTFSNFIINKIGDPINSVTPLGQYASSQLSQLNGFSFFNSIFSNSNYNAPSNINPIGPGLHMIGRTTRFGTSSDEEIGYLFTLIVLKDNI